LTPAEVTNLEACNALKDFTYLEFERDGDVFVDTNIWARIRLPLEVRQGGLQLAAKGLGSRSETPA